MNALDAIYQILTEAGQPLDIQTITARVLEQGLWQTDGETPENTLRTVVAVEIQKHGTAARIRRIKRGLFAANNGTNSLSQEETLVTTVTPSLSIASPNQILTPSVVPVAAGQTETLSFADAAENILNRFANREPMHYRDITKKAVELGLIESASRTPEVVMYGVILSDNQRLTKRGELPRFVRAGRGLIGLSEWADQTTVEQGLAVLIDRHNKEIRKKLHDHIRQISPADFEALVGRLLTAIGFESVSVTRISGDGGIDVTGTLVVGDVVRVRMAVQAKRWKYNIQAPVVQGLRGSLGIHQQGLIITTSDFSKGAREDAIRANATPIALMNGEQFVKLLIEHDIGIKRTTHDLIELTNESVVEESEE